jgi:four helix bundle protein
VARDHRKLRVFHDAHALAVAIYKHTKDFPKEEWYGMRSQMRRAATSIPTNLVEGSARRTTADYLRFLHIALGSTCELNYLAGLAGELELLRPSASKLLLAESDRVIRQLQRLTERVESLLVLERSGQNSRHRDASGVVL